MHNYTKFLTSKWRQKGAIIAFTALLLPMLIVGTGLAVDLGHVYVHYSRLQNAADAAALAGAHEYAVQGEKENNHPKADRMAEQYVQGVYHNLDQLENITDKNYQAKSKDTTTYYRVKLTKEVPLYFLGSFYEKIKGKNTFTVPVESVAAISSDSQPNTSGKGAFPNLFTFTDSFNGINTAQNPDSVRIAEISSTFTGRIVTNNKTAEEKYRHQLITNEARKKQENNSNYTVKNAIDDNCVNNPIYEENINLNFYEATALKLKERAPDSTDNQSISSKDYFDNKSIIHCTSYNQVDIKFNSTITGSNNNPLYIIVDNAQNPKIHFESNARNSRPIIYCYLGTQDIRIEISSNAEFHGIIYAPKANIILNDNNWHFFGSMVGKSISLNGKGDYTYEDFGIFADSGSGSSSGTSNAPVTNNPPIKLVSPESIKWN